MVVFTKRALNITLGTYTIGNKKPPFRGLLSNNKRDYPANVARVATELSVTNCVGWMLRPEGAT